MKFRIALVLAIVCYLSPIGIAFADARPRLDLPRAEREAAEYVRGFAPPMPAEEGDDPNIIHSTGARLVGCDRETRYRALCDIEVIWEDGVVDEDVITVLISRRGTYIIKD